MDFGCVVEENKSESRDSGTDSLNLGNKLGDFRENNDEIVWRSKVCPNQSTRQ